MNYIELTNALLRRFNEVELSAGNFAGATGFHAHAKDCINNAIRDVIHAELEWPFLFTSGSATLVSGTGIYALPVSAVRVNFNSFYRVSASAVQAGHLNPMDYDLWQQYYRERDDRYSVSASALSVPEFVFKTPNFLFGVTPIPSEPFVIKYNYFASPDDLSAATDTTSIPTRYHYALVDGGAYHVYMFRENMEQAQMMEARFTKWIKRMRVDLINRYTAIRDDRVQRTTYTTVKAL